MCVPAKVHECICRPQLPLQAPSFSPSKVRDVETRSLFVRSRSALETIMDVYWTNFRNELGKPWVEASSLNHQSPCPLLLDKAGPGGYFEAENYLKWRISLQGKMRNFYWRRLQKRKNGLGKRWSFCQGAAVLV